MSPNASAWFIFRRMFSTLCDTTYEVESLLNKQVQIIIIYSQHNLYWFWSYCYPTIMNIHRYMQNEKFFYVTVKLWGCRGLGVGWGMRSYVQHTDKVRYKLSTCIMVYMYLFSVLGLYVPKSTLTYIFFSDISNLIFGFDLFMNH